MWLHNDLCVRARNMSKRMKKYKSELRFLKDCSTKNRKGLIAHSRSDLIQAIGDASLTLLSGNIPLKKSQVVKLKKNINVLKQLASKQRTINPIQTGLF